MKKIYKILFIISFLPITFSLLYCVYYMIFGMDTGIVCITDPCPTFVKGYEAFIFAFYKISNIPTYLICLIYQLVYIFKLRKLKK